MSCKYSIIIGTILGMTSVIMGAFGAHYLESFLDSDAIKVFETGARAGSDRGPALPDAPDDR